jgi:hypothetical protein
MITLRKDFLTTKIIKIDLSIPFEIDTKNVLKCLTIILQPLK